jgi:cyclopropane fatty-acyl-phospholipid synthase-like methyltransferase
MPSGRRASWPGPGRIPELKPWDRSFRDWIAEAKSLGRDPNDVGDERWGDARPGTEAHYLPLFDQQSVVMEMGPGSGRYTRHLLPHCREMVLVDYSKFVCEWVQEYFAGKGTFRVVLAKDYALGAIADASIDAVVANGVFEHLYLEAFYQYLVTFERVMKPGARGCLNFNNIASEGGFEHFETKLPKAWTSAAFFVSIIPKPCASCAGARVSKWNACRRASIVLPFSRS